MSAARGDHLRFRQPREKVGLIPCQRGMGRNRGPPEPVTAAPRPEGFSSVTSLSPSASASA